MGSCVFQGIWETPLCSSMSPSCLYPLASKGGYHPEFSLGPAGCQAPWTLQILKRMKERRWNIEQDLSKSMSSAGIWSRYLLRQWNREWFENKAIQNPSDKMAKFLANCLQKQVAIHCNFSVRFEGKHPCCAFLHKHAEVSQECLHLCSPDCRKRSCTDTLTLHGVPIKLVSLAVKSPCCFLLSPLWFADFWPSVTHEGHENQRVTPPLDDPGNLLSAP